MTISSLTSTAAVSPYQSANPQNNVRAQINQLFQDVQSGNLSGAQSDYASLSQLFGSGDDSTTTSNGQAGQSSPFAQLLNQIGSSLQSGDISGAQSALSSFQSQLQQASGAGGHHHHHHGDGDSANGANGGSDPLLQLFQAVQNGDLSAAQQAYTSLTQASSNSTDSSSASAALSATASVANTSPFGSTSGSNSTDAFGASDPNSLFSQMLAQLGSALANNDITTAQQDLGNFAQTVKPGSAVSLTA